MAEAQGNTTEGPKKRRKPQGPRQVKPFHLLITARDADGNVIELTQDGVTIEVVKDPAVLLTKLTQGGMEGAVYKQFTPPSAANPAS